METTKTTCEITPSAAQSDETNYYHVNVSLSMTRNDPDGNNEHSGVAGYQLSSGSITPTYNNTSN